MASQASAFDTFTNTARVGSIGGTEDWGTESNAASDDATRATYSSAGTVRGTWTGHTIYLVARDLTTSIPDGATVNGIEIIIQRRETATDATTWADSAVFLIKGLAIQDAADNKAVATAYTTSDASVTYGGPTDLWGVTWTAAEINGTGFGVAISVGVSTDDGESTSVPEVDLISAVIYYTAAAVTTKKQAAAFLLT